MGLLEKIFKREPKVYTNDGYFKTLTAYAPVFSSWGGSLYESELVRSAIDTRARHISKLKVETTGAGKPALQNRIKQGPNEFMTWGQFLYRLSTILDMQNTAFIVPVYGVYNEINGFYPILPSQCVVVESGGEPWLRYTFNTGQTAAIKVTEVGIMTKFQYSDDFFGDDNQALNDTLQLIYIQKQGVEEAIKNSATYRFMAQLSNFSKAEDLVLERSRWSKENLSADANGGGLLLFPNTYTNITQLSAKNYTVDADQQKLIQNNVFNYYGVNEKALQNSLVGDEWSAFYEGAIEPFSVQFSEVMTRLIFTERERSSGSQLMATANRLQYMSNSDKLQVSAQMADRGLMTINEIRDIWNLKPLEDGDRTIRRGEYKDDEVQDETE